MITDNLAAEISSPPPLQRRHPRQLTPQEQIQLRKPTRDSQPFFLPGTSVGHSRSLLNYTNENQLFTLHCKADRVKGQIRADGARNGLCLHRDFGGAHERAALDLAQPAKLNVAGRWCRRAAHI